MKQIQINISKSEIFNIVSLNSAYIGAKNREDADAYDRIATVDADEELLSKLWAEICGEVAEKLREFISAIDYDSGELSITLEMSGAYDDSLTSSVKADLFSALGTGLSARWLRFAYPQQSEEWLQQSGRLLDRVFGKLCFRKKPVRRNPAGI